MKKGRIILFNNNYSDYSPPTPPFFLFGYFLYDYPFYFLYDYPFLCSLYYMPTNSLYNHQFSRLSLFYMINNSWILHHDCNDLIGEMYVVEVKDLSWDFLPVIGHVKCLIFCPRHSLNGFQRIYHFKCRL